MNVIPKAQVKKMDIIHDIPLALSLGGRIEMELSKLDIRPKVTSEMDLLKA